MKLTNLLSHLDQSKLILPSLLHELQELAREAAFLDERTRLAMCGLHDVAVAHEIAGPQLRQP